MDNRVERHPDAEQLLRHADGESSSEVAAHVECCEQCNAWLGEIESGVRQYRRVANSLAESPKAWADLKPKMVARESAKWPRWTAIAAGVLIAMLFFARPFAQRLDAAQLLQRSVSTSQANQKPRKAIRILTKAGTYTRPAVLRNSVPQHAAGDPVAALFLAANYNWADPLSAESFLTWRSTLVDRKDQVTKLGSAYEIRTSTESGGLAEASITLKGEALHPVSESFRFRNREVVVIDEIDASPERPKAPPSSEQDKLHLADKRQPVSAEEELRVWQALRRLNADLGEPVDVQTSEDGSSLIVTALGMSAQRKSALAQELSSMSNIDLRFREPQRSDGERAIALRESNRAQPPPLQARLEAELGGKAAADSFADAVLDASELALMRAHALAKLAERFGPERESQLRGSELTALLSDHHGAMEAAFQGAAATLNTVGLASTKTPMGPPQNWQAHCLKGLRAAQRTDRLLTQLLAGGGAAESETTLTQQLAQALGGWESEIAKLGIALRRAR